ncbi:MAG TPA: type II toxin-antitoxin system VapC family toxin [Patescibacteria group bacterium]|nr:type II toxin-antitoxin system VapC family toxin [Patescibacteria group bacterium]
MNKQPVVVIDADAMIAQTNPKDIHHQKATEISQSLIKQNAQVLYPTTTIAEATAHMQRVLNSTASAYGTVQLMTNPEAQVVEVNKQTLDNALRYFSPTTSKKNTLFDCIVAAIAEEYKADAIFSFDKFYKSKGFTLASELIEY